MLIPRNRLLLYPKIRATPRRDNRKSLAALIISVGDVSGACLKIGSLFSLAIGTALLISYASAENAPLPPIDASGYGAALAVFVGVLGFIALFLAGFLFAPTFMSSWTSGALPAVTAKNYLAKLLIAYRRTFLPFVAVEVYLIGLFLLPDDQSQGLLYYCLALATFFILASADEALASDGNRALAGAAKFKKFIELVGVLVFVNAMAAAWAVTLFLAVLVAARDVQAISNVDAVVALVVIYGALTALHILLTSFKVSIKQAVIAIVFSAVVFVFSFPGPAVMTAVALRAARIGGGLSMEIYDRVAGTVEPVCILIKLGTSISYRPNPDQGRCPMPFTSLAKPSEQAEYRASLLPAVTRNLERGRYSLGQPAAFTAICPRENNAPKIQIWKCTKP